MNSTTSIDGDVVLRERYGSSDNQIIYVVPNGHSKITIVDSKSFHLSRYFYKIFLPQGYPESVSTDYISYQIWDTAQAFCSTITGTIATQEVLRGVGVGNNATTPLAATITWVIKDCCGHTGKILFAYTHGTFLDAYSKRWRLVADILNDLAMCIEMALPFVGNYTTVMLCASTVMKSIVGVAGGATRVAMTQHHAVRGNMADVAAKDSAQETAVNLIASFTALAIISSAGINTIIFAVMIILHIFSNYMAVRAVCLKTLNEPRYLQVIEHYLKNEIILSPLTVNARESIFTVPFKNLMLDYKTCGFNIEMGKSLKKTLDPYRDSVKLKTMKNVYDNNQYILFTKLETFTMHVFIKESADADDILCAYFHAVMLSSIILSLNKIEMVQDEMNYFDDDSPFDKLCEDMQKADWSTELLTEIPESYKGYTNDASEKLHAYVNEIVDKEWIDMKDVLLKSGWDLSKQLLVVDEWRVVSKEQTIEVIPVGDSSVSTMKQVSSTTMSQKSRRTDRDKRFLYTIEPDSEDKNK